MTSPDVLELGRIFADPDAYADPRSWHEAARRIRDEQPILPVSVPGFADFWAITKHADVLEVERHPDVFTNAPIPVLTPATDVEPGEPPVKTLIQMDGDEHKAHRGIVNEWFKPGSLRTLQDRVDLLAQRAVDQMASLGGTCDFVNDVALHFPLQVILSILGLPEADHARMLQLTQELFGAEDADIGRLGEDEGIIGVLMDFVAYFTELASNRRSEPTEDLASVIANAQLDDEPLSDLDMIGHYVIIATAGHDTTSNAISGGLLALLEQPDQLDLLRSQPDLIDHAADELIRWVAPVKHFMRTCQRSYEIRGHTFEPGDRLYLSYASANRDDEVFEDPMRLDVRRENASNHVAFGFGRHFCLGAHLARMEVRALFRALVPRLEHIELAAEPTWIRASFVQGPKHIPIRYQLS